MARDRRRPLPCGGCGLKFAWCRSDGGITELEFPPNGRPPSRHCAALGETSACRFHVTDHRAKAVDDLEPLWNAADEVSAACMILPGGELTLGDAGEIVPLPWSTAARRLLDKALQALTAKERKTVMMRAVGAVEPGVVEIREKGFRVRRLVVMHAHLVVWGISRQRLRKLLRAVLKDTQTVIRPLVVKRAKTPAGALGYAWKHQNDHRAQVRDNGKAKGKRRLEPDEAEILRRWSALPAADAAVMVGMRRNASGRIAPYGHTARYARPRTRVVTPSGREPAETDRAASASRRRRGSAHASDITAKRQQYQASNRTAEECTS